jgi:peroxiredoxin
VASGAFLGGLLLAGFFAVAGAAKLADLEGSRTALAAFGVPGRLAAPLGTLLPLAELGTAALLVAGAAAGGAAPGILLRSGALAALLLLALFCAGIAVNLLRGRAPDCHCFGQLHSAPASGRTLARNGVLLILAAFVASGGDSTWTTAAGATALAMLGAVAIAPPGRRPGPDDAAPDRDLPLGTPAPDFELPSLDGAAVSLAALREKGRPVLLVFTDPGCGPCLALAPDVASWQLRHAEELTIAVIENRNGESAAAPDEHGRERVLLQHDGDVAEAYRARGTPTAVLVGPDGAIASPVAGGSAEIEALVAENVTGLEPVQPAGVVGTLALDKLGGRLIRRELLLRGAGAWAATGAAMAWPLRAVAGVTASRRPLRCRRDGDCGPKQKCQGQGQNARCKCKSDALQDECGRDCTDFQIDDDNCGGCAATGDDHDVCIQGRSTCVGGDCVSGNTDPDNCDAIGCGRNTVCCEVPTGNPEVQLFGCMDLNEDIDHCGGCNRPCTQGKTPACCGGKCVDTHGDPRNCGECGKHCEQDEVCHRGKCEKNCPSGLRKCTTGRLRTCYQTSSEICCGGRVTSTEGYTNPKCCGNDIVDHEEGAWFCP